MRLNVNGGYYHYMMDIEHVDGDMMKRYLAPNEPMGDLFKADGNGSPSTVEGPWGKTDETPLDTQASAAECPNWTTDQRYEYSYQRSTHTWDTPALIRGMVEEISALRAAAIASNNWAPVRAYYNAKWDYEKLRDYIVIRNWAQPWDDGFHNHHFWKRKTDGKWLVIPQDKDREWGEHAGYASQNTQSSFLVTQFNTVKDTFIRAFQAEVWARVVELDGTVLSPAVFRAKVDAAFAIFSNPDYQASPAAAAACNAPAWPANIKAWAGCRHQVVKFLSANPSGTAPACSPSTPCTLPECL
jgi:hypothetical protein